MKTKDKESILFDKWREKRAKFIPDGIVNPEIYSTLNTKVLYILKEVNGGNDWNLCEFLQGGARWQTWNNIVRWQYAIEHLSTEVSFEKVDKVNNAMRKQLLSHIAAINIKKEPGTATSKMEEIWSYSWQDRMFLKEQIKLYNPTIIICCGTGKIVRERELAGKFAEWKIAKNKIKYQKVDNRLIIDFVHPQSRKQNKVKLFNQLFEVLKESVQHDE